MKALLLAVLCVIGTIQLAAQPDVDWAWTIGNSQDAECNAVAIDSSGNIYVTGYFRDVMDFDPGPSSATESAVNSYTNVFIAKYDSLGNFLWSQEVQGQFNEWGTHIDIDINGNIYLAGCYQGTTVDFDPGPGTYNLPVGTGNWDAFILKLNATGNFIWAKGICGGGDEEIMGMDIDLDGNVYTTGTYRSTVDFDPGPGTYNLTAVGGYDIFISKLDSAGNFGWAVSYGSDQFQEEGYVVGVDLAGNVYASGRFEDTVDFDPGPGTQYLYASTGYRFLVKLDSTGNLIRAENMNISIADFTIDGADIYLTGSFGSIQDFDPGPGVNNLTSSGGPDIFLWKLDTAFNYNWAVHFGATSFTQEDGFDVMLDSSGSILLGGRFYDTGDFNPGPGVDNLYTAGLTDIFLCKFDAAGNFGWAVSVGGTNDETFSEMEIDPAGKVVMTGFYLSPTLVAGPVSLVNTDQLGGTTNIFLMRLDSTQVMTGTGALDRSKTIEVHPNPANDQLFISVSDNRNCTVEIFDITGKCVLKQYNTGSNTLTVNVEALTEGLYTARVSSNSEVRTYKIVIAH